MRFRFVLAAVAPIAAGWSLWHYIEYRSCGERSCSPPEGAPVLRLDSGRQVAVLSTRLDEGRDLVINYLTAYNREDMRALCAEAREVWEKASETLDTRRLDRAVLGPTSPESEFLGMKYLVVPLYTCCVSTHLRIEKEGSGSWVFPQCPEK
jgi:hypothetical protein